MKIYRFYLDPLAHVLLVPFGLVQVFSVDWSPDGSGVASGGKDHVVKLWRQ